MSIYDETRPIELCGGPLDGMDLDVTGFTDEVRRDVRFGTARYVREDHRRFRFAGYATEAEMWA